MFKYLQSPSGSLSPMRSVATQRLLRVVMAIRSIWSSSSNDKRVRHLANVRERVILDLSNIFAELANSWVAYTHICTPDIFSPVSLLLGTIGWKYSQMHWCSSASKTERSFVVVGMKIFVHSVKFSLSRGKDFMGTGLSILCQSTETSPASISKPSKKVTCYAANLLFYCNDETWIFGILEIQKGRWV